MTALAAAAAAAAFLLGLALRRRRLARAARIIAELRHELSKMDGRLAAVTRRARGMSLQNAIERRRTRAAAADADAARQIAAEHLRKVWALSAENEVLLQRVAFLALAETAGVVLDSEEIVRAAMGRLDGALRELEAGSP